MSSLIRRLEPIRVPLVLLALVAAVYWVATGSGLWAMFVSLQAALFSGEYHPVLTFLLTLGGAVVPAVGLMLLPPPRRSLAGR
jgi:hypothetical protein